MLAGEPVPHRSRATPVSWSCRFVAGSGRAGHCGTGSAFVPQIALLIAAATANRRVLASGRNLEVIPATRSISSWKVSRRRLRPASCSSLPISRISTRRRHCRLVKPGRRRRPHLMKWSRDRDACFLILGNLQMLPTRKCSSKMSRNTTLFRPESFSNPPSTSWLGRFWPCYIRAS